MLVDMQLHGARKIIHKEAKLYGQLCYFILAVAKSYSG